MSRTYVVTGAGAGIGLATASLLREQGFEVIGVDLKNTEVIADLSTPAGRQQAVADVLKSTKEVDAIVACAGVAMPKAITVAINYFGVTEFVEGLVPTLAKSKSPRVVVVSSMASLQPNSKELVDALLANDEAKALEIGDKLAEQGPNIGYLNYSSSKRAISRWIRKVCITERFAGQGIAINAAAPGTVITDMTKDLLATAEARQSVDSQVPMPLNYHSKASDVAKLLIWLTSVDNSHVTGQTIYIDGGADATLRGDDIWS